MTTKTESQLQLINNITDSVYEAIQNAIADGSFIIKDADSVEIGEGEDKVTKELSILLWVDDEEFEITVKHSEEN